MSAPTLELVVMDWAGTAVDFGSVAPIVALEEVFANHGISVSRTQLRLSMGLAKKTTFATSSLSPRSPRDGCIRWRRLDRARRGESLRRVHATHDG